MNCRDEMNQIIHKQSDQKKKKKNHTHTQRNTFAECYLFSCCEHVGSNISLKHF